MGIYKSTSPDDFDTTATISIPDGAIPSDGVHLLTRDESGEVATMEFSGVHRGFTTLYTDGWEQVGYEYRYTVIDEQINNRLSVSAYCTEPNAKELISPIKRFRNMIVGDGYFIIRATALPENDIPFSYEAIPIIFPTVPELKFRYTGDYEVVESVHPLFGTKRGYVQFLTSGELIVESDVTVDLAGVGAGGGTAIAGAGAYAPSSGGGGGYTDNKFRIDLKAGDTLTITIGEGVIGERGDATTIVRGDDELLAAEGGYPGTSGNGGNGGSGGGGKGGISSNATGGNGGSNGSNGTSGNSTSGGTGQGFTTRPFLGDVAPFATEEQFLHGAGGAGSGVTRNGVGGMLGGGTNGDGLPNTGGGGGSHSNNTLIKRKGGSGTAFIRWGDWSM